jgi:hypothetical protein
MRPPAQGCGADYHDRGTLASECRCRSYRPFRHRALPPDEPAFGDGQWHRITIPLASLATTKTGTQFDLSATWELRISARSAGSKQFDIYLDRIAAEK